MVNLVGKHRMPLLTLTGFIIEQIFDVAYNLNPPCTGSKDDEHRDFRYVNRLQALQLTHAIVPPTPTTAAAAIVGADIGRTIIFGGIACSFGSLACWAWVYILLAQG